MLLYRVFRPAQNFYPRSPCGERQVLPVARPPTTKIFLSTLSLRRATARYQRLTTEYKHFYPRSPCGERHRCANLVCAHRDISIHALLAESDAVVERYWLDPHYFYPRSPCGERRRVISG